jgi:hypothetical protein
VAAVVQVVKCYVSSCATEQMRVQAVYILCTARTYQNVVMRIYYMHCIAAVLFALAVSALRLQACKLLQLTQGS